MFDQVIIALIGPLAIWLSQDKRKSYQRWASVIGLFSQIFWFHFAYTVGAWGVVVAHIGYTYAWWCGIKHYWIDKPDD